MRKLVLFFIGFSVQLYSANSTEGRQELADLITETMERQPSCIIVVRDAFEIMQDLWCSAHSGDQVSAKAYETFLCIARHQFPSFANDKAVIKKLISCQLYNPQGYPDITKVHELQNSPLCLKTSEPVTVLLDSRRLKK